MTFSNNPHTVYNGLISGQRNMFLSSSLAIALIGVSAIFKNTKIQIIIKILGAVVFMLSIIIGLAASDDFRYYLDNNKEQFPSYIPLNNWYKWSYVSYIYSFIIICVASLFLINQIIINTILL